MWFGWLSPGVLTGILLAEALRAAIPTALRRSPTPPDDEQRDPRAE
jgi:hypothetical protein